MRRIISFLFIMVFLFLLPIISMAVNPSIDLYLNGQKIHTAIQPQVKDNQPYVPLQFMAQNLGVETIWNASQNKASLDHEGLILEFVVGQSAAGVNGKHVELQSAPFMFEGNMYIPLQFVGEQLGIKVSWDILTQSITLYKKNNSFLSSKELFETKPSEESIQDIYDQQSKNQLSSLSTIESINNQVVLQFDAVTTTQSFYLDNPRRFVIDLPSSKFAGTLNGQVFQQNGEIASNHPMIHKIRYAVHDASKIRIVIELNEQEEMTLEENKITNQVIATLKSPAYKVVIDAGHGGKDPGAEGASEKYEKHFVLKLSQKIQALLDQDPHIKIYMTRTDDSFISLDDRVLFANNLDADLFISIHGNTYISTISGTETFYWNNESLDFAKIMHKHVLEGTQLPDRKLRKMQYRVLRDTKMPAALLELGYLSNANEERKMLTEEFQNRVAASIVNGLKEYLEIK